jgi:DNA-binding NarL/FixJ family response regulator
VSTAAEALQALGRQHFNVVILDVTLAGRGGLEFLSDIRRAYPRIPILVFGLVGGEQYATRALQGGAAGFLARDADGTELAKAVQKVASGGKHISPTIAEQIALEKVSPLQERQLSNREYDIFRAIASGKTLTQIAEDLAISVKTVSEHKRRIMRKLSASNNVELIRHAVAGHLLGDYPAEPGQSDESGEEAKTGRRHWKATQISGE